MNLGLPANLDDLPGLPELSRRDYAVAENAARSQHALNRQTAKATPGADIPDRWDDLPRPVRAHVVADIALRARAARHARTT